MWGSEGRFSCLIRERLEEEPYAVAKVKRLLCEA